MIMGLVILGVLVVFGALAARVYYNRHIFKAVFNGRMNQYGVAIPEKKGKRRK